jgi:hypothetical protein
MGFKFGMIERERESKEKKLNFPFKLTGDAHNLKVHFPFDTRVPNLESIFPLTNSMT